MSSARAPGDGSTPPQEAVVACGPQPQRMLMALWLVVFLAFGVSLARANGHDAQVAENDAYIRDLRALPAADATLTAYVLQARLGILARYDPLVDVSARLERLHTALLSIPSEISSTGRSEITARVQASTETFHQKEARVEQFKSENAVLKNASRYFPVAAGEFAERCSHRPGGVPLATAVQALSSAVMRFELLGDPPWRDLVAADIAALRSSRSTLATPEETLALDELLAHAQIIHDHKPRVDALVLAIASLPTMQRSQSIEVAYVTHHDAAVARRRNGRAAMLAEALLLLAISVAQGMLHRRGPGNSVRRSG